MGRKLTSIVTAMVLVAALIPAPRTNAVNSEIFYRVDLECQCWCTSGEWTKPCEGEMYGWGIPPYGGEPPQCYHTYVTYGEICD
jgi:hypothetical protein